MRKEKEIFIFCLIFFLIQGHVATSKERHENTSLIPAGEFLMGTEEGTEIERPVHKVYLEAFRISLFEVSNREFEMFQPKHIRSASSSCDKCPVTMISWYEAISYCKSKNARLPSEAEWEKAARGPAGYRYSFGEIPDQSKSNFSNSFKLGAKTVRSFQPNGYGLYNMSGNVWEWVADWFYLYSKTQIDKLRTRVPNAKMVRGGSWYNSDYYINLGMRFKLNPEIKLNSIGFRCAWDVQ
tara:strand:+ start:1929 stop:2645 length:717 start_codon:yes stop_codon:yes gene_type:complete